MIRLWAALLCVGLVFGQHTLRINEAMSANSSSLMDNSGDYPDWVEVFNGGPDEVAMDGYFISDKKDQPAQWALPGFSLAADSFFVFFASGKKSYTTPLIYQRLITRGDSCRYVLPVSDSWQGWKNNDYDDSHWKEGLTGIGYGDGDDATIIDRTRTVYVRQSFDIPEPDSVASLFLHIDYDDGFVAYINGSEVARANIGEPGEETRYDQWASANHEARIYQGGHSERFELGRHALQKGANILAIEVHNFGENSSDLSCIPFLTAGYKSDVFVTQPPTAEVWLPRPEWHAPFKVDSNGETLYLSDGLKVLDSLALPALNNDASYGRLPDGSESSGIFLQSSPGAPNNGPLFEGRAPQVKASLPAGFYTTKPRIFLSADSLSTIHYTTDGSFPDASSALYAFPFRLDSTTVIRARAYRDGYLPGPVFTATYFVEEDVTLPVISLAVEPEKFFDEEDGIYVHGPDADSNLPYFGANFWKDIEVEVTLSFFDASGEQQWQVPAGVKISGGWSRAHPQKSLAVFMRGRYGEGSLDYMLFPGRPVESYEAFVLRNGGNDWESTLLRDPLAHTLASNMDIDYLSYRPVLLFINGRYWGIHNIREKANEHYFSSHYSVDPDSIDLLENKNYVIHGSPDEYVELQDYLRQADMSLSQSFEPLTQMMDVDSYIDYMLLQQFVANTDWPGNNVKYWQPRAEDGLWRWLLFDTDFGFGLYNNTYKTDMMAFALQEYGPNWPNPHWSTELFRLLTENPEFKRRFSNRAVVRLNGAISGSAVLTAFDSLKAGISAEVQRHHQRWGRDISGWHYGINVTREFAEYRPAYFLAHIMQAFGLASGPSLTVDVPGGGTVFIEGVPVSGDGFSAPFFAGQEVQLEAVAQAGYRFSGWQGVASSEAVARVIPNGQTITALFSKTAQPAVAINEINYNSHPDFECEDWLELYNHGTAAVDLSGWLFKDSDDSHIFELPAGSVLDAGEYLVLSRDTTAFRSFFPDQSIRLNGPIGFGFDGAGELLRLYNADGQLVDSVHYLDEAPWPPEADGDGPTLELLNPARDNALAENWQASAGHGTPGAQNSVYTGLADSDSKAIPKRFNLGDNYPNPFNPQTKIAVALPRGAFVDLVVYDMLGRKVKQLQKGALPAGEHHFTFNARGQASGIYFYSLKINGRLKATKKMLLLK